MSIILLIAATLAAAVFAARAGGPAERASAWLMLAAEAAYLLLAMLIGRLNTAFVTDGVMFVGLCAIFIRWRAPWVLSALAVRLCAFALHWLIFTSPDDTAYHAIAASSIPAFLTVACLVAGVVEHARSRRAQDMLTRAATPVQP